MGTAIVYTIEIRAMTIMSSTSENPVGMHVLFILPIHLRGFHPGKSIFPESFQKETRF